MERGVRTMPVAGVSAAVWPWPGEIAGALRAVWLQVRAADPEASIFTHPEWLACAARARVIRPWGALVISLGARPIALLPLLQPAPWRRETASISALYDNSILFDPEHRPEAMAGLAGWLRAAPPALHDCGFWRETRHVGAFRRICREHGLHLRLQTPPPTVWVMLPACWEDYLAQLGKKTRHTLRHALDDIRRDFPDARIETITDPGQAREPLAELAHLHRRQWDGQVGGSVFNRPRFPAFYLAAMQWAMAEGYGAIFRLRAGGRTAIVGTALHIPGQRLAHYHTMARLDGLIDPHKSPGLAVAAEVIHWAISRGAGIVNLGPGRSDYKITLHGLSRELWAPTVTNSAAALAWLPKLDRALHIAQVAPAHLVYRIRKLLK